MKTTQLAIAYCSVVLALPAALAADKKHDLGGNLDPKDSEFVLEAAQGGMMEVEVGKLGRQKGSDPSARQVGDMLVNDHGKANEELKGIVSKKGATLPTSLDAKHQAKVDQLAKKEGAEFDKAYFAMLQDDHKKDIAKFEHASQSLKDSDLKAFATKTLPVLRTHLEHVSGHGGASAKKSSDKTTR
jgi:putative membrane protein